MIYVDTEKVQPWRPIKTDVRAEVEFGKGKPERRGRKPDPRLRQDEWEDADPRVAVEYVELKRRRNMWAKLVGIEWPMDKQAICPSHREQVRRDRPNHIRRFGSGDFIPNAGSLDIERV